MKKLKGIVLAVIFLLASIMMPFDVYAAVESTIVPTFSSSTSEWNGHLHVTNFSDGTNNQASSSLHFTFDDDYYGMVYFDGYGPSNQHIANYAVVFIAGGFGEYRYSYYQNGVINITQVTIQSVNVVKPDSSVDLTQIIQLLTAIETDTTAIDNILDATLTEIRSVLSQLIISNNYLDILTNLYQWNIPFESFSFVSWYLSRDLQIVEFVYNNTYISGYPAFLVPKYQSVASTYINANEKALLIFVSDIQPGQINTYVNFNNGNFTTTREYTNIGKGETGNYLYLYKYIITNNGSNANYNPGVVGASPGAIYVVPILMINLPYSNYSTDFALRFGLSNQLLDDLNIIANGTNQSNQAASDLESGNDQMADDMNDLATIENGYNQQFNNQLQSIDFTSPIQNNAGILPAANFVITIFNGLINNNPFSVLIIVVCILLIGKKVIGK